MVYTIIYEIMIKEYVLNYRLLFLSHIINFIIYHTLYFNALPLCLILKTGGYNEAYYFMAFVCDEQ